jgi:hypothetical protein
VYKIDEITPQSEITITSLYDLEEKLRDEEPTDNINGIDEYFFDENIIKSVVKFNTEIH